MEAIYRRDAGTGRVELRLIPWALREKVSDHRAELPPEDIATRYLPEKWQPVPGNADLDSILPLRLSGDRPCGA